VDSADGIGIVKDKVVDPILKLLEGAAGPISANRDLSFHSVIEDL